MSLEIDSRDVPKPWRPAWTLIAFLLVTCGGAVAAYATAETRIEAKVDRAAEVAVERKWTAAYQEQALKACTSAADQGAYRAVTEAMQQTVIPLQRTMDKHLAAQAEHEMSDEKRFSRLERRLGMAP